MQVNVFFMHAILHRDCDMFNIVLLVLFSEGQKFSHKNQNYFRRSELFIKGFLYFLHDHIQITYQITIVLRVGPSCCRPSIEELFVDISKTCQKRIWLPFTSSIPYQLYRKQTTKYRYKTKHKRNRILCS